MIKEIETIQLEKSQPLYQQMVSVFEQNIYTGKLLPGDKLPTTLELSKQFNLAKNTVQQALTVLAERGMVERTTGRGTYISKQVNCQTIAIVSGFNYLFYDHARFHQLLCGEIKTQAEAAGWTAKYYLPESENNFDKMLYELGRDIDAGSIRGVFVNCPHTIINNWLEKNCRVPYFTESLKAYEKSDIEHNEIYRGLSYLLRERSFKKIAIVGDNDDFEYVNQCIAKSITDFCPDAKIDYLFTREISESDGYRIVKDRILGQKNEFEALLVLNDILCKGVIFGLMEKGIKIPDDLAVITHANKGIGILCPVPLTKIEADPGNYASCAL
jgi:DNA-binding FadR family transcriptional regulator